MCGFDSLLAGSEPVSSTITYLQQIAFIKLNLQYFYSCLLLASKTTLLLIPLLQTPNTDNTSNTSITHSSQVPINSAKYIKTPETTGFSDHLTVICQMKLATAKITSSVSKHSLLNSRLSPILHVSQLFTCNFSQSSMDL